jgi:AraC-like DNA-binding protein
VRPLLADLDRALAERERAGAPGGTHGHRVAAGEGWSVTDVVCTAGPDDRPFEERHERVGIAIVVAGSFGYRASTGRALLTPGSLLLGDAGCGYECGHDHGRGDRCLAFQFAPATFERIAADAGLAAGARRFGRPRLPPLRETAPFVARAAAGLAGAAGISWEELAVELAGRAATLAAGLPSDGKSMPVGAEARVAAVVRRIEREPAADASLAALAGEAGMSSYHFLRAFERATGVTPHQFLLRTRLRAAALALAADGGKVIDAALDSGFGDLANFHRAFRAELGVTPAAFRRRAS